MTRNRHDTVSIPYAYLTNTPLTYGIGKVSVHKRRETRNIETCDGIKTTRQIQQSLFALEVVKAPPFSFLMRRGRA